MMTLGFSVGPYVFSLLGIGVAITGTSAWLAMIVAMILGLLQVLPWCFAASTLRLPGHDYQIASTLLNRLASGIWVWCFPIMNVAIASLTASLAMYIVEIFTDNLLVANLTAVAIVVLFYLMNLRGVGTSAKVQDWLTYLLLISVVIFAVYSCVNITPGVATPSDPMWMTGGVMGFFGAMNLFTFFSSYHTCAIALGNDAKNPYRDLPRSIALTSIVIMVLYGFLAFVVISGSGFEKIVGVTVTAAARNVMPLGLFIAFMILGPLFSILSSINASFVTTSRVMQKGAEDGWFPKIIAKENKHGAAYLSMLVFCLIAVIPTLIGYDIMQVVSNSVLLINVLLVITLVALWQLPSKYPEAWKKSRWHVPDWLFRLSIIVSFVVKMFYVYISANQLTAFAVALSGGAIVVFGLIAVFRHKKGYVPGDIGASTETVLDFEKAQNEMRQKI
jgi:APA family basic amino acid/polyamine antiporter